MACRGIFYALTLSETDELLKLVGDDDALSDSAKNLYSKERDAAGFQADVDKAWDAMHRCLGDGKLNDCGEGITPLSRFVLGGRNLYQGDSYIICLVTPEQVRETVAAANKVTEQWMRDRYFKLVRQEFGAVWHQQDCEYTWSYFEAARTLFNNASAAGRAVLFLADQ